jgi:pSer/pThr/pTyr-binding forkhead associated (FHA) protein
MSNDPIYVQLSWEDPATGKLQRPLLAPPIAIGRDMEQMPEILGDSVVSRLALENRQVSRFHALITLANYQLYVTDRSANGTFLNGQALRQGSQPFSSKDTLRIGPYKITASLVRGRDLDNATELTSPDAGSLTQETSTPLKNTLFVWLIGGAIMIIMAYGAWLLAYEIFRRLRPRPPEEQSMVDSNLFDPVADQAGQISV